MGAKQSTAPKSTGASNAAYTRSAAHRPLPLAAAPSAAAVPATAPCAAPVGLQAGPGRQTRLLAELAACAALSALPVAVLAVVGGYARARVVVLISGKSVLALDVEVVLAPDLACHRPHWKSLWRSIAEELPDYKAFPMTALVGDALVVYGPRRSTRPYAGRPISPVPPPAASLTASTPRGAPVSCLPR